MSLKIKLSIGEIVRDFEKIVRYDERLDVLFDNKMASDEDINEFHKIIEEMTLKYIPTYKEKISSEYFSEGISTYDRALMLYKILYENFKEIFYQLV